MSLKVSQCVVSYKELLQAPEVSSTDSIPTDFCSQKLWGLIFLALESWAGEPGVGLGLLASKVSLLNFYPGGCGPAHSVSVPLLPWMWLFQFHRCQTSIQLDF